GSPAVPAETNTSGATSTSQRGEPQGRTRRGAVRAGGVGGALTGDLLHPSSYDLGSDVPPPTGGGGRGPTDRPPDPRGADRRAALPAPQRRSPSHERLLSRVRARPCGRTRRQTTAPPTRRRVRRASP